MTSKIRIIKSLAKREVMLTMRRLDQILLPLLFNFCLFFIALLLLEKFSTSKERIIYSLMMITSTITLGFTNNLSLEEEFKRGILERFFLLPIKAYYVILLKGFFSLLNYLLVMTLFYWIIYLLLLETFWPFYYKFILISSYLGLVAFSLKLISIEIKGQFFTSLSLLILTFPEIIITLLSLDSEVYLLLLLALIIILLPLILFLLYLVLPNLVKN